MSEQILTEEELALNEKALSNSARAGAMYATDHNLIEDIIASHRSLLSANAELSFKNMKLKTLLINLDSHIDFSEPPTAGEWGFEDVLGINQVFKEAYRIVNPEQAAINEAQEELK